MGREMEGRGKGWRWGCERGGGARERARDGRVGVAGRERSSKGERRGEVGSERKSSEVEGPDGYGMGDAKGETHPWLHLSIVCVFVFLFFTSTFLCAD